ncbi:MAG: type III-A CRISPR-associated RAMP protein Csm3 [Candidatus Obscuribacterales bacterium]|nr:type III-A CRISPR-associated RAMP protein Csm3 [Candidatus Obscuribacterales bacterium]
MDFVGRLFIRGRINVLTGLHIGTGGSGGIGLVDNPVIRDPLTRRPIIPGSSLKGRLRHALEIVCGTESDDVIRLFGGYVDSFDKRSFGRMFVRDSHLTDESAAILESIDNDSLYVEIKTENRIDRARGVAEHPRQSERLPAGAIMGMELVYNAWGKQGISDDIQNLEMALRFVEDEYIGGCGSRGYGKVSFEISELVWTSIENYRQAQEASKNHTSRKDWVQTAAGLTGLLQSPGGKK